MYGVRVSVPESSVHLGTAQQGHFSNSISNVLDWLNNTKKSKSDPPHIQINPFLSFFGAKFLELVIQQGYLAYRPPVCVDSSLTVSAGDMVNLRACFSVAVPAQQSTAQHSAAHQDPLVWMLGLEMLETVWP
ncbi:unnamed protein product [Penicillium manginii]